MVRSCLRVKVATLASGQTYSRVSQTFNGTVTIRNIRDTAILPTVANTLFLADVGCNACERYRYHFWNTVLDDSHRRHQPHAPSIGYRHCAVFKSFGCHHQFRPGDLLREPGTNDQQPLSFSSAVVGASARTLTVNGANFVSNSTVTYSAVAHASTFVSAS
jgi:hypothetical protein